MLTRDLFVVLLLTEMCSSPRSRNNCQISNLKRRVDSFKKGLWSLVDTVWIYMGLGVIITIWFVIIAQYIPFYLFLTGCKYITNDLGNDIFHEDNGEHWPPQSFVECDTGSGTGGIS